MPWSAKLVIMEFFFYLLNLKFKQVYETFNLKSIKEEFIDLIQRDMNNLKIEMTEEDIFNIPKMQYWLIYSQCNIATLSQRFGETVELRSAVRKSKVKTWMEKKLFFSPDDDFPAKTTDVHSASHSSVVRPQHSKVYGGHPHPGRREKGHKKYNTEIIQRVIV